MCGIVGPCCRFVPFVNALVAFSACQKIVPYAGHERQTVVGIAMLRAPSSVLRAAASKTDREPERERDSETENEWVGELSSKGERKRVKERERARARIEDKGERGRQEGRSALSRVRPGLDGWASAQTLLGIVATGSTLASSSLSAAAQIHTVLSSPIPAERRRRRRRRR